MAKPTLKETTDRVVKAFRKIGFGGKFATYDVTAWPDNFIELHKFGSVPGVCFRIVDSNELVERSQSLTQHISGGLLQTLLNEKRINQETYVAARLVQNMQVKLYPTQQNGNMYFDEKSKTLLIRYGTVIVEVCPVIDYNIDVNTNDLFAFLDELSYLQDECKNATDAVPYTKFGKLYVKLGNGYVVETDVTVKEFNDTWS